MISYFERHAELYEQHYTRLFHAIYMMTRDPEMTEDIVQEAFARLMKSYPVLTEQNPTGLVNVIAKRILLDLKKKPMASLEIPLDDNTALLEQNRADPQEYLFVDGAYYRNILARLCTRHRTILLALAAGYSYPEIGQMIGVKRESVRTLVRRARKACQREMEEVAA